MTGATVFFLGVLSCVIAYAAGLKLAAPGVVGSAMLPGRPAAGRVTALMVAGVELVIAVLLLVVAVGLGTLLASALFAGYAVIYWFTVATDRECHCLSISSGATKSPVLGIAWRSGVAVAGLALNAFITDAARHVVPAEEGRILLVLPALAALVSFIGTASRRRGASPPVRAAAAPASTERRRFLRQGLRIAGLSAFFGPLAVVTSGTMTRGAEAKEAAWDQFCCSIGLGDLCYDCCFESCGQACLDQCDCCISANCPKGLGYCQCCSNDWGCWPGDLCVFCA